MLKVCKSKNKNFKSIESDKKIKNEKNVVF